MTVTDAEVVPYWKPEFDRLLVETEGAQGRGVVYLVVTIPRSPAPEQVVMAEAGNWPVRLQLVELQPQLRDMIDFLVDEAASRWPTT